MYQTSKVEFSFYVDSMCWRSYCLLLAIASKVYACDFDFNFKTYCRDGMGVVQ